MPKEQVLIPNRPIFSKFGGPWTVVARDDAGALVQGESVQATTYTLLRELLLILDQELFRMFQALRDGKHSLHLWRQVERSRGDANLTVGAAEYQWLHEVLTRKIPVTKEVESRGVVPRTIAMHLYGTSDFFIMEQLKSVDEMDQALFPSSEAPLADQGSENHQASSLPAVQVPGA